MSELFFCLFSVLFGVGAAFFHGLLHGTFSAFRILPPLDAVEKKKKYIFGYLFFDLFFCLTVSSAYMIFLFAAHNGVFRVYSLLLACGGAYLLRHAARRFCFYPAFFLFARALRWISLPIRWLLRKCTRKNKKKLDEAE